MGVEAQVLLVTRRAALLAGIGALAVLGGCRPAAVPQGAERVRARDYQAFFLWAGVAPPAWLGEARTVYALAGEVRHRSGAGGPAEGFVPLRSAPHAKGPEVWMSVRVERLDWEESVTAAVLSTLARWAAAGGRVVGLQIDFDAATHGLEGYAAFLEALRARLPRRFKLSITGLMDWSAGAPRAALARLAGVVDEIVVQTYQGRTTLPGTGAYLATLGRLGIRFRVALVEGGVWQAPAGLERTPGFSGYVVFLVDQGSPSSPGGAAGTTRKPAQSSSPAAMTRLRPESLARNSASSAARSASRRSA